MTPLQLRFRVFLQNQEITDLLRPQGPLFYRWLPDGRIDALNVAVRDTRNRLQIWFERRGRVRDGFIRYEDNSQEVDEAIMLRQARLDAGVLHGEAHFAHTTKREMEALIADLQNSDEYVEIGKRVIGFLFPPLSDLVDTLRVQYGQYWLKELRQWDSRRESLGSYCSTQFGLVWRVDEESDWRVFSPTAHELHVMLRLPGRTFEQFLTEADWRRIQQTFRPEQTLSIGLKIAAKAHVLMEIGHDTEALVQAVSGLELALDAFLDQKRASAAAEIRDLLKRADELPLAAKLVIVVMSARLVADLTLGRVVEAITVRNKIVHEGWRGEVQTELLNAIFDCIKALLGLDEFKRPTLESANSLEPPARA